MKNNNILIVFVVIAIVIAIANISVTLFKVSDVQEGITGYVEYGYVNITVIEVIIINMTNSSVAWGHGMVDPGEYNATLITNRSDAASVVRGNWSTSGIKGLRIENIGNLNASLTFRTAVNGSQFFGSATATNEMYQWNITDVYTDANTCTGGTEILNQWREVNLSAAGKFCEEFNFQAGNNSLSIDIWLTVPYDSNATSGEVLSDTITATATA
jgi:hypothetical protein